MSYLNKLEFPNFFNPSSWVDYTILYFVSLIGLNFILIICNYIFYLLPVVLYILWGIVPDQLEIYYSEKLSKKVNKKKKKIESIKEEEDILVL